MCASLYVCVCVSSSNNKIVPKLKYVRKYSENNDTKFEMQSTQSEKGLLRRRLNGLDPARRRRRRPLAATAPQQQDNQKVAMADIVFAAQLPFHGTLLQILTMNERNH